MQIEGWKYYIHAAIPTTAPHEPVYVEPIENGEIWKIEGEGTPFLARWHSDWDCGYETEWWYCIKDTPFDISSIKSKRRYEINKGNKNFVVKEIHPQDYAEELYKITIAAYETYPKSYRPIVEHEKYINDVRNWNYYRVYGAFSNEDNVLSAFACLIRNDKYIDFAVLKAFPDKEKLAVNAAIVNKILIDHSEFIESGGYICDGARSVQHETAFQDYLEKYFEFRKAYCKLHIKYRATVGVIIWLAYPLRGLLEKLNRINAVRKLNVLIKMEEIHRSFM